MFLEPKTGLYKITLFSHPPITKIKRVKLRGYCVPQNSIFLNFLFEIFPFFYVNSFETIHKLNMEPNLSEEGQRSLINTWLCVHFMEVCPVECWGGPMLYWEPANYKKKMAYCFNRIWLNIDLLTFTFSLFFIANWKCLYIA